MESFLGRYKNLIWLVAILFLQVLGLAVQVRTNAGERQDTRLIRIWAVGAITPFERAVVWVQNSTGNVWHNYFYLRGVRAENRQLKAEIEQMRLEQVRLSEDAAQARRLQNLLAFKEQFISKTVAAQVIGTSGSDLSRVVYIDKGKNDGIDRDMAVITADGIVGKVLFVYPGLAQVLLISDQSSGVGAVLSKSRLQGVLRGTANGEVVLERVMKDEQVQPGETVLTSGGDQIFPKGLPVGTVTRVANGRDLFLDVNIKPAANLSKLEEVLVLTEKQERLAVAEGNGRMRAADILAQRLPSVPDKPVTPAGAPATGTSPQEAGKPVAQNAAANANSTTPNSPTGAVKPATGTNAQHPAVTPGQPPRTASQSASATKPKPASSVTTEGKPETAGPEPVATQPKPDTSQGKSPEQPSIVEQKPASPAVQPETPPPAQDNSPQ
jgi:rod shape-determining protein MreC